MSPSESPTLGTTMIESMDEPFVAAAWDANCHTWVHQVRSGCDRLREDLNAPAFLDFLPSLGGLKVLDLGCGEGFYSRKLAANGAQVVGADLSPEMIRAAQEHEATAPLGIKYKTVSGHTLVELEDSTFDCVVAAMTLMCAPNLGRVIESVFRVLRPGSTFYFSVTHPCFWTRSSGWLYGKSQAVQGMLVSEYFNSEPYLDHWTFEGAPRHAEKFAAPRFPHRVEDYINALSGAGFWVRKMSEPRPSLEAVARHPWLERIRSHVPIVMFVHAFKP